MAHTFRYAILQLIPFAHRDETINIGIVIFREDRLQVRLHAPLPLLTYFGVQAGTLDWLAERLKQADEPSLPISERTAALSVFSGVRFSEIGWFAIDEDAQYEGRISEIISQYVDKPTTSKLRTTRKTLISDLRKIFRDYSIYGSRPEDIDRHKIVSRMPVGPSGKLHVDFLLKNACYHATETLDFRMSQHAGPAELKNAALASVTFRHARDFLGSDLTRCYLVYAASSLVENVVSPAIEIAQRDVTDTFNLESRDDKNRYIDTMLSAAGRNSLFA